MADISVKAGGHAAAGGGGKRAMGRLRAERVVAAAQRLSPLDPRRQTDGDTKQLRPATGHHAARAVSALVPTAQNLYLQQSGVQFLLEDLVKRLQDERPEAPAAFIASYFASALAGTNVRAREFEYVNGTLQNQIAFFTQLQCGFAGVDPTMEITSDDFAELVWSHCSDVPSVLLNQASSHLTESPEGAIVATLHNFLTSFGACLLYNDFLSKVHDVYAELVQASRDGQPSSPRSSGRSESIASAMAADRVVARLRLIAQQASITIPPLGEVESFVFKSASFREVFCALFFLSPAIAATIRELQDAFAVLSGSDNSQIR